MSSAENNKNIIAAYRGANTNARVRKIYLKMNEREKCGVACKANKIFKYFFFFLSSSTFAMTARNQVKFKYLK